MLSWLLLAALLVASGYALWRLFLGYPRPVAKYVWIAPREAAFLDAAAAAVFPDGGPIPLSGADAGLPRYADSFLEALPAHLRLQVRAMFMLFEQATIFFPAPGRGGRRRFSALDREQRVVVLEGWSESRFFLRRIAFTALRAMLTMGYLGHPDALRALRLAPYEIETPVCEADLLYPRVGELPDTIAYTEADLTPPSDGTPIDIDGRLHRDYEERPL